MINGKRKGARAEHRCMRILEAAGYLCSRAAGSMGMFDVVAVGPQDVRLVQVKCGPSDKCYLPTIEREQITALPVAPGVSKECWRFHDGKREPLIEVLR